MPNDYSNLYGRPAAPVAPPQPPGTPEEPPKPFTLESSSVDTSGIPQGSFPPPLYRQYTTPQPAAAPPPAPPKEKKPFSPIPLLLIAGVAFLFLGGVIFLTSTWDVMPNAVRAVTLLSASAVAFAANLLAEKVFRLQKTGVAFYILGCIFLPLSLGGIGQFALFGDWFSFAGEGCYLVWASICLSMALSTWLGQHSYRNAFLAWMSLIGTAGTWSFLSVYAGKQLAGNIPLVQHDHGFLLTAGLWTLYAIGATVWTEWYLRRNKDKKTPFSSIALAALYPILVLDLIGMCMMSYCMPPVGLLALVMAVLFCNMRFTTGKLHFGVLGSSAGLMVAAYCLANLSAFRGEKDWNVFLFMVMLTSVVLMACRLCRREVLAGTYSVAGIVFAVPGILFLGAGLLFTDNGAWVLLLGLLVMMGAIFFAIEKKGTLPKDAGFSCLHLIMVFEVALLLCKGERLLFELFLTAAALLMLAEAFLARRIWPLMTAVAACAGILLVRMPALAFQEDLAHLCTFWLFAAGFLGAVIYAHLARRPLLEKAAAWTTLAFIFSAFPMTLDLVPTTEVPVWILTLALTTLLYLLEAVVFWKHSRTAGTRLYLEILAAFFGIAGSLDYTDGIWSYGWGVLVTLLLATFAVAFTMKRQNAAAILPLGLMFVNVNEMLDGITERELAALDWPKPELCCVGLQMLGFAALLGVYAVMGRVLVKEGMFYRAEKTLRLDWPLLVGVLPVVGAAVTIDWHPNILAFLFLTFYSLLYIGRVKHRRIPALLASLFGCTTLLMHNAEDPFRLFALWHDWEVRTPQILLYLLPIHLFIFTLLWILPKDCRPGVHISRFVMYCITMLCLLLSSMSFGNVADAIILVVFSFLILFGSFMVKRLRWFTLGFAVLFVMTIRLTWSFWTSLHWGIYLFLAGALLIVIASVFELKVRRAADHPEEQKKSKKPFADWRW